MSLTTAQVAHIAKLARLNLMPHELDVMTSELSHILEYVKILNEVKTDDIEPTSQVTGIKNALREDEVGASTIEDVLLECSPLSVSSHQIQVPHAHG